MNFRKPAARTKEYVAAKTVTVKHAASNNSLVIRDFRALEVVRASQTRKIPNATSTSNPKLCVKHAAMPQSAPARAIRRRVRRVINTARAARLAAALYQWCVESSRFRKTRV